MCLGKKPKAQVLPAQAVTGEAMSSAATIKRDEIIESPSAAVESPIGEIGLGAKKKRKGVVGLDL